MICGTVITVTASFLLIADGALGMRKNVSGGWLQKQLK
jgi:hypothetical protein